MFRVIVTNPPLNKTDAIKDSVEAPRGQDAVEREHLQVPGPRVLREVADGTGPPYGSVDLAQGERDQSKEYVRKPQAMAPLPILPPASLSPVCCCEPRERTPGYPQSSG